MSYNTTERAQTVTSISIASSGDNNVVTAVAGKAVYVMSGFLVAAAPVTLIVDDGTSALTGAMSMIAGVPFPLPPKADGKPYFVTTLGNALSLKLGGSVQVSGWLNTVQA